jgi:hypothetical protein
MNGVFFAGGVLAVVCGVLEGARMRARWQSEVAPSHREKLSDAALPFFAFVYGLYMVQDSSGMVLAPWWRATVGLLCITAFLGLLLGLGLGSWSPFSPRGRRERENRK